MSDQVIAFLSYDEFINESSKPGFWDDICCLVTDYYLNSPKTGVDVAIAAKEMTKDLPLYLCSSADELDSEQKELFQEILPKHPKEAVKKLKSLFN